MFCKYIFKYIFSYLNSNDIIPIVTLSKNTNKIIKELDLEIIEYDIDRAHKIFKTYNNIKLNLIINGNIKNNKKLNDIKNNIISFRNKGKSPTVNMENLEYLNINFNEIENMKFKLKKLKHIYINNPYISKSINISNVNSLKYLNNIEILELEVGISISLSLADFRNLKKLNCRCCTYMKNEDIKNLINLELLCIINNLEITNDAFKNLGKIKTLLLYNTLVTSEVLKYLPNIEILSLDNRSIRYDDYKYMENVKKFKLLDLSCDNKISDENIKNIDIEHIILSNNDTITISGLGKNIKKIDLERNSTIKNEDLKKLDLIYLNLSTNNVITDEGLKFCKNLKILNLYSNSQITDEGLKEMKNLEYLNLKYRTTGINNKITDNSLKELKKLKHLNLEFNKNITNDGIKTLTNLEYLNIKYNTNITIDALLNLKNLKEIECQYSRLSKDDLYNLTKNNKNLKIIIIHANTEKILPSFYYSKKRNFINDYDEIANNFLRMEW